MKRLSVLVLAALLPVAALAQNTTRPTSFMGVPWGATPEETMRILSARTGLAVPEDMAATEKLELTGGRFAGQDAARWTLEFGDRKLYSVTVHLKPQGTTQALYRELKQMLIAKYGAVNAERKLDARDADKSAARRDRTRIIGDEKTYGTVASWKFEPTLKDKERKVIELALAGPDGGDTTDESMLSVTVRYVNETLKPLRVETPPSVYKAEPSRPAVKVDDL